MTVALNAHVKNATSSGHHSCHNDRNGVGVVTAYIGGACRPVWITVRALMRYHHSVLASFVRRASAFEKREWLKWVELGPSTIRLDAASTCQ
jgi:hypothetical protein